MNTRRVTTAVAAIIGAIVAVQLFTQGYRIREVRLIFDLFTLIAALILFLRLPPSRTMRGELGRLAFGVLFFALTRTAALVIAEQVSPSLVLGGRVGLLMLVRPVVAIGLAWSITSIIRLGEINWIRRRRRVVIALALIAGVTFFEMPVGVNWLVAIYVVLAVAPTTWVDDLTGRWGWTAIGLIVLAPVAMIAFAADVSVTLPAGYYANVRPIGVDSLDVLVQSSLFHMMRRMLIVYWIMIPLRITAAFFQGNFGLRIPIAFKFTLSYLFSTIIPGLLLLLILAMAVYLGIGTMRARMVRNMVYKDLETLEVELRNGTLQQYAVSDSVSMGVYVRTVAVPETEPPAPPPTPIPTGLGRDYTPTPGETAAPPLPADEGAIALDRSEKGETNEYWVKVSQEKSLWAMPDTLPAFPGWNDETMGHHGLLPLGQGRSAYAAAVVETPGSREVLVAMDPLSEATLTRYKELVGVEIAVSPHMDFSLSFDDAGDVRASEDDWQDPRWNNIDAVRTSFPAKGGILNVPIYHGVAELEAWPEPDEDLIRMVGIVTVRTTLAGLFGSLYTSAGINRVTTIAIVVLGVLFLLAVLFSSVLAFGITRTITGSIASLHRGTEQLRRGDLDAHIEVRNRDELGDLAVSFNRMTADLKRMIRQVAEKERLEQEMQIARQIQLQLLPSQLPETDRLKLAARSDPAQEVGGDYFDAIEIDRGRILIALGDVSGKGVGAAMLMSNLQANLHILGSQKFSLEKIASDLNRQIWRNSTPEMFITCFLGILDCASMSLTYVNAGHDLPLLLRDGEVETLSTGGLLLGVDPTAKYVSKAIELRTGDIFACYSDGVTEAMDEEDHEYGIDRFVQTVTIHREDDPWSIVDSVLRSVRGYAGDERAARDDLTLMVIKVEQGAASGVPA